MRNCDECFDCRKEDAKPKLLSLVEVAETLRKYHAITRAYAYSVPLTELLRQKPVFKTETLEGYRPSCILVDELNERYKETVEERYKSKVLGQWVERPSWDEYFLDIAKVVATRADCTRRKVGAVIVKNNRIISTGYNGAPAGKPGCLTDGACPRGKLTYDEQPKDVGYANCGSVHAEANSLLYAHRDISGATMYVTDEPCHDCSKLIAGAGITRVVTGERR